MYYLFLYSLHIDRWMAVFSVAYIFAAILLHHFMHDAAFVYANMLNLILRIFYAGHFTYRFFKEKLHFDSSTPNQQVWSDIFPPRIVLVELATTCLLMLFSSIYNGISIDRLKGGALQPHGMLIHSILGAVCFACSILIW